MIEMEFKNFNEQYRYFISFCYKNNNNYHGFGNGTFILNNKITSSNCIKEITEHLKFDNNYSELVILGVTLLEVLDKNMRC